MKMSDVFNTLFEYKDGFLFWKVKPSNNRSVGDQACHERKNGYRRVIIKNKHYFAHRVIFEMFNGYSPEYVDHKDRNNGNNLIGNLRDAASSLNNHNKGLRCDNSSGCKGVSWSKSVGKWHSRIHLENKLVFSKYFKDKSQAITEITQKRGELLNDT